MPAKHCLERGCANTATYRGRCQRHAKQRERATHPNKHVYNRKRWGLTRRAQLDREPFCRECRAEGVESLATDVDHIVAIQDGGDPWREQRER